MTVYRGEPTLPRLLTDDQLLKILDISSATLWRLRRDHRAPPSIRIGKQRRTRREDLEGWLAEQETFHE